MKKNKKKNSNQKQAPTNLNKTELLQNWLFMSCQDITARNIKEFLDDDSSLSIEIWDELGILEITSGDDGTLDFEQIDVDLKDDYSNQFLADHQIKSLFFVHLNLTDTDTCHKIMRKITQHFNAFFCGDTEDFTPMVE